MNKNNGLSKNSGGLNLAFLDTHMAMDSAEQRLADLGATEVSMVTSTPSTDMAGHGTKLLATLTWHLPNVERPLVAETVVHITRDDMLQVEPGVLVDLMQSRLQSTTIYLLQEAVEVTEAYFKAMGEE